MERLVIAAALMVVATVAAVLIGRRRPDAPTQDRVHVPRQLDRAEFSRPEADWLVVVFTSVTCQSCERATAKARVLESDQVAYQEVPWQSHRALHDRYRINDVPLIVMANRLGVVHRSFVGTPSFSDLAAALAEAREPGSTPEPDVGRLWVDD